MVLLDTDHMTALEWGSGEAWIKLTSRLQEIPPFEVFTSIISYEEQTRGWLAKIAQARTSDDQIRAYSRLRRQFENYRDVPLLDFDQLAATEFAKLRNQKIRVGTMDLRIASIALANSATLVSRNLKDFRQVPGLAVEDWTT